MFSDAESEKKQLKTNMKNAEKACTKRQGRKEAYR